MGHSVDAHCRVNVSRYLISKNAATLKSELGVIETDTIW